MTGDVRSIFDLFQLQILKTSMIFEMMNVTYFIWVLSISHLNLVKMLMTIQRIVMLMMMLVIAILLMTMTRSLYLSLRVSSYDEDEDVDDDYDGDDDEEDGDEDDDNDEVSLPVFASQLIASREVVYSLVTLC